MEYAALFHPPPDCPLRSPLYRIWLPALHRRLEQLAPPDPDYTPTVLFLLMMYRLHTEAFSEERIVNLVDRLMELPVRNDLKLQQCWAHAAILCPTTHLQRLMPRILPLLTSPYVQPAVFSNILSSVLSIATESEALALLSQHPIERPLIHFLSDASSAMCITAATFIQCLIASATNELPFLDRMMEAGLCDVARFTALLQRDDGAASHILNLIHQLQAERDMERLILKLIPALIPHLTNISSNDDDRSTALSILCNCIQDASSAEHRTAILNSNLIPHLILTIRPDRADLTLDEQLLELCDLDRAFPAIHRVLEWGECDVGPKILHPFAARMVQMRLVPWMEGPWTGACAG